MADDEATDPNSANADGSNDPFASEGSSDPFAPENAPFLNFIMQARIYDVLMALVTDANPELAKNLLELHAQGNIMGSQPSFNGVFITDEILDEDDKNTTPEK